jgi:hypothetical protein
MNHINKLLLLLLTIVYWSCNSHETEKYQNKRNNIIYVQDKINEVMEDVIASPAARLFLIDDYLLVRDSRAGDKLIQLFDKNNFNYVTSTGYFGAGPGEIAVIGHIGTDELNRVFYVSDHAKQVIYGFDLDSVLANSAYLPSVKMKIGIPFPDKYQYINDTLSIGLIIEPVEHNDFKQIVSKWNMNTGDIMPISYEHPAVAKKRSFFSVSMDYGIYVECYNNRDLMTICDLQGNLKHNIYGPNWGSDIPTKYFTKVIFYNNHILATYSGENWHSNKSPTKFFVFDLTGNYIKTIETGYQIVDYCYDKENNRLILFLNEEFQFAYLDLDGLLD